MSKYEHLESNVAEALTLPTPERIAFCQEDRWIGYTQASQVLKRLDELLVYPRSLRMPNLLIIGRSGNGKSSILQRFFNRHPVLITESGSPATPIVHFQMPEIPDERELWSTILWAQLVSHSENSKPSILRREVISILQYTEARLLVIDEFNNLANSGKAAGGLLSALKNLSNDLKIPIVAAGTQAAINVLNSDPQMKSRFEPAALVRWKLDREYLRFLASYERFLPLAKPSGLASRILAPKIYGMAGDTIGGAVKLVKAAAVSAINSGKECIDLDVLDGLGWTRPGDWDEVARRI